MKKIGTLVFVLYALVAFLQACKKEEEQTQSKSGPTPYNIQVPSSLPSLTIPADNPLTVEGVALGRKLFYDPVLSGNNQQSCGSCHNQSYGFTDNNRQFSTGIDGLVGTRNSMPLFNIGYASGFFWDGGASSMESQVVGPVSEISKVSSQSMTMDTIAFSEIFKQRFTIQLLCGKGCLSFHVFVIPGITG